MLQYAKIRNDKIKIKRVFRAFTQAHFSHITRRIDMKFIILLAICVTFGAESVWGKSQSKQEERKSDWWQSANVRLKIVVA